MLLCGVDDVRPGMIVGAGIQHPNRLDKQLLKPGFELTASVIERLKRLGVTQLWVQHDLTADLDGVVDQDLSAVKQDVFRKLKQDFRKLSGKTVCAAEIQTYRTLMKELVSRILTSQRYASLVDQLFQHGQNFFTHCTNVAYLSITTGLELKAYVIQERPRLSAENACDLVNLGLAGVLHDVGKLSLGSKAGKSHECTGVDDDVALDYAQHPVAGHQSLRGSRIAPSVVQTVLNHHQRYDGNGWPDLSEVTGGRITGVQRESGIHVFSRIVSAANVLDNLLVATEESHRPPVAALADFAGPRFDGWFDPVVRRAMLRCIPPFAVGSHVRLNDGREAVVTEPDTQWPCRPVLRILGRTVDPSDPFEDSEIIRLTNYPQLHITDCAGQDVGRYAFDPPAAAAA